MGSGHDHQDHSDSDHGHGHGHGHGLSALDAVNAGARYKRPLKWAFLLTVSFVAVEWRSGSRLSTTT